MFQLVPPRCCTKDAGLARRRLEQLLPNETAFMRWVVVFVDAIEAKTGSAMRVRIPLNVVNIAHVQVAA